MQHSMTWPGDTNSAWRRGQPHASPATTSRKQPYSSHPTACLLGPTGTMETSTGSTENITDYLSPMLSTHPAEATLYLSLTGVAMALGIPGNIVIISVFLYSAELRKTGNEFIVNIALADLCVTAFADPMCILGFVLGESFFLDKDWLCDLVASVCLSACICGILSLTLVTISRWWYVCNQDLYRRLFSRRRENVVMCISLWVAGAAFEIGNFLGWGDHVFDRKTFSCIWNRVSSRSYTCFVALVLIGTPFATLTLAHGKLFNAIWKAKVKVYSNGMQTSDKALKETLKSSRTLFVLYIVFFICWGPYRAVILSDMSDTYSYHVHLWTTWLVHLHAALNFCIYFSTHRRFRSNLKVMCSRGRASS